jgi:ABC transporter DrrB family efflux protein
MTLIILIMLAIETHHVRKTFGSKTAIESISLKVSNGNIHAILGPNGSGKTTLVRLCTTLLTADSGSISVGGFDTLKQAKKVREIISLTGQNASVDEELSGSENLVLFARLLGYSGSESTDRAKSMMNFFDLAGSGNQLVKYYSGGMRRKLDLAISMLRTPGILFLDEPTTGLDPRSRNELWTIIKRLSSQGTTILLTTQYMEEADRLADRITVLDRGVIISEGTSDELKALVGGNILQVTLDGVSEAEDRINSLQLEGLPGKSASIDHVNRRLTIPVETPEQAIESLDWLRKEKLVISNFHLTRPNLDEVFLALTGKMVAGTDEGGETARGEETGKSDAGEELNRGGRPNDSGAGREMARGEETGKSDAGEELNRGGRPNDSGAGREMARERGREGETAGTEPDEKTVRRSKATREAPPGIESREKPGWRAGIEGRHAQAVKGHHVAERPDLRKAEIDRLFGSPVSARHSGIITQHLMFAWRALLKIKHIPEQYIDVLVTPVMFTFMFTYLFGGAVAGSTREYLQFLIPGILVQTLTFNTMYAGINIHTDISKGIFDRFRSMPVWLPAPLAGFFIGDLFRYLISGIVVMTFGALIGFRPETGIPGIAMAFVISILFASSVSWMAVIIGLTFRNASAVMSIGWLILTPVVFMSNIYVDPVTMPEWLQTFIAFNPLSWQVDAVRSLLSGRFEPGLISMALAGSLFIGLLFAPVGIYFYRKER